MAIEPLGAFRVLSDTSRVTGSLALVAALALGVVLQGLQLRLRRAEAATWWASNGRDLINVLALGIIFAALWLMGFPAPSGLLVGATVLLLVNLLENAILNRPGLPFKGMLSFVAALIVALPVLIAPERVHELASRLAASVLG